MVRVVRMVAVRRMRVRSVWMVWVMGVWRMAVWLMIVRLVAVGKMGVAASTGTTAICTIAVARAAVLHPMDGPFATLVCVAILIIRSIYCTISIEAQGPSRVCVSLLLKGWSMTGPCQ